MIQSTMFLTKSLVKKYLLNFFEKISGSSFNDSLDNELHCIAMFLTNSRGIHLCHYRRKLLWEIHWTMFLTRSRGSGKITVEFFSALMLFNVWNRAEFQDYDDDDLVDEETGDSAESGDSTESGDYDDQMVRWDEITWRYRNCKAELL